MLRMLILFVRKRILKIDDRSQIQIAVENGFTYGKGCQFKEGCIIDPGHCFLITLGDRVTLAPRVHLLAHDASTKNKLGYTKIGLVNIGDDVFIGANSTVLPGVTIGSNSIIGANSLVSKDVPAGCVYAGNPARLICTTQDYLGKHSKLMKTAPLFDESYIITNITDEKKSEMKEKLKDNRIAFIV